MDWWRIALAYVIALSFGLILSVYALPASARDFKSGSLTIVDPWTRATPKGAATAAGYLTIKNEGNEPDRLIGATFKDASRAQIHMMSIDHGVMHMGEVPNGLAIKPHTTVEFSPEGYHLMLMGLKAPLSSGTTIDGSLTFEKAGEVPVTFSVETVGAKHPSASKAN